MSKIKPVRKSLNMTNQTEEQKNAAKKLKGIKGGNIPKKGNKAPLNLKRSDIRKQEKEFKEHNQKMKMYGEMMLHHEKQFNHSFNLFLLREVCTIVGVKADERKEMFEFVFKIYTESSFAKELAEAKDDKEKKKGLDQFLLSMKRNLEGIYYTLLASDEELAAGPKKTDPAGIKKSDNKSALEEVAEIKEASKETTKPKLKVLEKD